MGLIILWKTNDKDHGRYTEGIFKLESGVVRF
jgi:hypothetical protein